MMGRSDVRPLRGVIHVMGPGVDREIDTFTCPHCNFVGMIGVQFNPDTLEVVWGEGDNAGWCFKCGAYLCKSKWCHDQRDAAGNPTHLPYIEIIWESASDHPKLPVKQLMGLLMTKP